MSKLEAPKTVDTVQYGGGGGGADRIANPNVTAYVTRISLYADGVTGKGFQLFYSDNKQYFYGTTNGQEFSLGLGPTNFFTSLTIYRGDFGGGRCRGLRLYGTDGKSTLLGYDSGDSRSYTSPGPFQILGEW